ncbi:MAG: hypothetical protein NDF56_07380 [archaeon GB-1845-036]|nr:hypothetical protein [Candidatus Culexmicrobium thermophilum]
MKFKSLTIILIVSAIIGLISSRNFNMESEWKIRLRIYRYRWR